jgi:hypothetical protein
MQTTDAERPTPMSTIERLKLWFRTLWAALEAAEEGSYGYMDRQISTLNDRVRALENQRSNGAGRI